MKVSSQIFLSLLLASSLSVFALAEDRSPAPQDDSLSSPTATLPLEATQDVVNLDALAAADGRNPLAGVEILQKYERLTPIVLDDGIFFQEIHQGSGASPEKGDIIYFMVKAFSATGGELILGDTNHQHIEGTPDKHPHDQFGYRSRWTHFGGGGGSFSLGTVEMDLLFSRVIEGMQELGTRLIYIPSECAYGSEGYTGHEFKILENTDLVLRVSLIRVTKIIREDELGFRRITKP